jgi:hypothetical protein
LAHPGIFAVIINSLHVSWPSKKNGQAVHKKNLKFFNGSMGQWGNDPQESALKKFKKNKKLKNLGGEARRRGDDRAEADRAVRRCGAEGLCEVHN